MASNIRNCPIIHPILYNNIHIQHLYVDASSSCNTVTSTISSTDTTTSREWNIKVTQIECSNKLLPPSGCLQYFTGTTGYLYNFGWVAATTSTGDRLICSILTPVYGP